MSKKQIVLAYYPKAYSKKVDKHTEIWCNNLYLGQGKTAHQAWAAAYNQNIID